MGGFVAGPCHCARAWTMSFTSMVPITIFSLLTVSWAAAPSRRSRVTSTRLPLVTVLAANLPASKQRVRVSSAPLSPPLVPCPQPLGCSCRDWGGVCHPQPLSQWVWGQVPAGSLPLRCGTVPRELRCPGVPGYLYSLSAPQGTRPTLAAEVTCWTMAWSLRHFSGNVSFSVISLMPVSFPAAGSRAPACLRPRTQPRAHR